MVSSKDKIKEKIDSQAIELEKLLGAMLAPVAPRGEFVNHLQKQLESKYDPQSLMVIPAKILNLTIISSVGLLCGVVLAILGFRWFKRKRLTQGG